MKSELWFPSRLSTIVKSLAKSSFACFSIVMASANSENSMVPLSSTSAVSKNSTSSHSSNEDSISTLIPVASATFSTKCSSSIDSMNSSKVRWSVSFGF